MALALLLALCRTSPLRVVRETATFWVEIVRGVPMLVILYYIAFIGAPGIVEAVNAVLSPLTAAGILSAMSIRGIESPSTPGSGRRRSPRDSDGVRLFG